MIDTASLLLAQAGNGGGGGGLVGIFVMLIQLAIVILLVAGFWKMFEKAGEPGWAAIIPFYNVIVLLNVAKRPGWWLLLIFVPLINLIVGFIVAKDISENFGQGLGFALGIFFLPFIFYPILGFGPAEYEG